MKVRSKLALATGLGLLILLGMFYAGGRMVIVFALKQAAQSVLRAIPEVRRSVQNELNHLEILAQASSSSLQDILQDHPEQVPGLSNVWDAATLDRLGVDLLTIADPTGQVILSFTRFLGSGVVIRDSGVAIARHLQPEARLVAEFAQGSRDARSGLVMLAQVPMLAAVSPIVLPGLDASEHVGVVMVGRAIEDVHVLRRITVGFPLQSAVLQPADVPLADRPVQASMDVVSESFQFDIPALWRTSEQMRARLPFYDVYGNPVLALMVSLNYSFKGLSELALAWLTLFVACVGALFIGPMFLVQGRTVLDPLTRLVSDLQTLEKGLPNGRRLGWRRNDEFGVVATTIDEMLDAIDREHHALVQSNEHTRALLAASPDLICVIDRAGVLIDVATQTTGRMAKICTGISVGGSVRHVIGIPSQAFANFINHIGEVLDTDRIHVFEYDIKHDVAGMFWVEIRMVRLSADHALVMLRDITDRRHAQRERARIEEKMAQVQKTESLGVLAGGMAHDFNNILTAMLGNVDVAIREELSPVAREAVENLRLAMIRASTLTRQMLSYAGQGTFTFEITDLNLLMKDLVRLMKRSLSPQAEILLAFGDQVPLVEADATQIWQVVMNLLINASDAMASLSGTITLTTAHATPAAAELDTYLASTPLQPGSYAMIEVSDTGHGMDQRTIERIYDPFFTTKAMGRGLGLSACLGIVRAHNGGISVTSKSGEGTRFRVLLPAAREPSKKIRFPAPAAAEPLSPEGDEQSADDDPAPRFPNLDASGTAGKILVADDDAAILRLVEIILKGKGYTVVTAESGEAALLLFDQNPDSYSLALIDVTMSGGMNGMETCNALHMRRSLLPTIIMSGYREKELGLQIAENGLVGFLPKPFMSADLLVAVAKAFRLAQSSSTHPGNGGSHGTVG